MARIRVISSLKLKRTTAQARVNGRNAVKAIRPTTHSAGSPGATGTKIRDIPGKG